MLTGFQSDLHPRRPLCLPRSSCASDLQFKYNVLNFTKFTQKPKLIATLDSKTPIMYRRYEVTPNTLPSEEPV
ncbi:hypothetical protein NPIL_282841 [Nephila pilipes]|uniref:Uncharacterized protein n=1 Tax=Nephila pilipes TaxID=299642 RepID=A0A8X6J024_NEPPI|nr:hypothetical protein NPIL_282841 [Nephila pilipes]